MAEVTVTAIVNLRVTDSEWKLIMKSLAAFAGVKISTNGAQRKEAEALNKALLLQRRQDLREQLENAEAALLRAEQASEPAPVIDPDMIDQFTTEEGVAPPRQGNIPQHTMLDRGRK